MGFALVQYNTISQCSGESTKGSHMKVQYQKAPSGTSRVEELKEKLKSLLAKYYGDTKNPDVVEVVDQLSELNPAKENAAQSSLFLGEFYALTCPNFPGRIEPQKGAEDLVQYTLGRLSFNIFQPHKLVCTLRSVRNPVSNQNISGQEDKKTFSYPLVLDITIHTPDGDLPATLVNEAYCYENPDVNNRIMVSFSGGTLMPAEEIKHDISKLKLWAQTFEGAYKKADTERSYFGWFFQSMIRILLGLTVPSDDSLLKHTFHFGMKRSPVGYLDVLYLDEDLRITRGNRGTIVVVERSTSSVPQQ
jgi:hypothetical protein